jgi:hypothetical protein
LTSLIVTLLPRHIMFVMIMIICVLYWFDGKWRFGSYFVEASGRAIWLYYILMTNFFLCEQIYSFSSRVIKFILLQLWLLYMKYNFLYLIYMLKNPKLFFLAPPLEARVVDRHSDEEVQRARNNRRKSGGPS